MNYLYKYTDRKVIHFNKWSNTSYAIFNSIGRIIHIGFLSQIIYGLTTVKSIISYGFLELISEEDLQVLSEQMSLIEKESKFFIKNSNFYMFRVIKLKQFKLIH